MQAEVSHLCSRPLAAAHNPKDRAARIDHTEPEQARVPVSGPKAYRYWRESFEAAHLPLEPGSGRRQHMRLHLPAEERRTDKVMGVGADAAVVAAASPPPIWEASARTWAGAPSESAAPGELETGRPSVAPDHRQAEQEKFAVAADVQPRVVVVAVGEGCLHGQCVATAVHAEKPHLLCFPPPKLPPPHRHS